MIKKIFGADEGYLRFSIVILVIAVAVLIASVVAYVTTFGSDLSGNHSRWGQFGDYLGGILNPGFSLLALLALLYTIDIQRRELRNSTRELENSVRVLTEQSESLKLQNFERTFFEMIMLHQEIIRDMDLDGARGRTSGRDCFRVYCKRLRRIHERTAVSTPLQRAVRAYDTFDRAHRPEVGHYFRNFYRVLKYVHETTLIDVEKKANYTGILRAQLSSHELVLMFYGTLHSVGKELKPLVEQYFIFDNLEFYRLYDPANEVDLYSESAYGRQDVAPYFSKDMGGIS